jgi:hypothetical protein
MNLHELSAIVSDETKAFTMLEALVWPNGSVGPHCENPDKKSIYHLGNVRIGLKRCGACRKQFTVRVGPIFEDSHIPLGKWPIPVHMVCASKKGVSAVQLQREFGLSYKQVRVIHVSSRPARRDAAADETSARRWPAQCGRG